MSLSAKYDRLLTTLKQPPELAIAFSGGVDSSLLLAASAQARGAAKVRAASVFSCLLPASEQQHIKTAAAEIGVKLEICRFDPLANPKIAANPKDRCYWCKQQIIAAIKKQLAPFNSLICDGTNADDLTTDRPGLRALKENNICSPLADCGLHKSEIRALAQKIGLSWHALPPAACLATRITTGWPLQAERLALAAKSEEIIRGFGFSFCRARLAAPQTAQLEFLAAELPAAQKEQAAIFAALHKLGLKNIEIAKQAYIER